jgi:AraC-like DNA-binding protein
MGEHVRERAPAFDGSTLDARTPQYSNAAATDPLSDVLRAVRLNGAHFYHVEAGGKWSVLTVPAKELVPRILPNADHLISYHILLNGSCWGGPLGEQIQLNAGDVIVFPHGDAHLMSSAKDYVDRSGKSGTEASRFLSNVYLGPSDVMRNTELVCGFLGCDSRPFNPLIAALPRVIVIPGAASGFLSQFPQQVVAESRTGRVGSETMLTRMAELMFMEVLRRYVEMLPPQEAGWLGALRDNVVGPALSRLHEQPTRAWTLAELAREIASSRTVLVERFSQLVGVPPMLYLTRWRLQLAAEQLARGSAKVAAIGAQVGYESEAAFSRAFKRETGLSPAAWRRARQTEFAVAN